MKKIFIYLVVALTAMASFTACETDLVEKITINTELNSDDFNAIPAKGTKTELKFHASNDWKITVGDGTTKTEEWLSVSPTSGVAGDIIATITTLENITLEARKKTITITIGTISENFEVTQVASEAKGDGTMNQELVGNYNLTGFDYKFTHSVDALILIPGDTILDYRIIKAALGGVKMGIALGLVEDLPTLEIRENESFSITINGEEEYPEGTFTPYSYTFPEDLAEILDLDESIVIPPGLVSCFVTSESFNIGASKLALDAFYLGLLEELDSPEVPELPLPATLEELLKEFSFIQITEGYYILPIDYVVEDGKIGLFIDRAYILTMSEDIKRFAANLLGQLPDDPSTDTVNKFYADIVMIVDKFFSEVSEFEVKVIYSETDDATE